MITSFLPLVILLQSLFVTYCNPYPARNVTKDCSRTWRTQSLHIASRFKCTISLFKETSSLHHPPVKFQSSLPSFLQHAPSSSLVPCFPRALNSFYFVRQFGPTSVSLICIFTLKTTTLNNLKTIPWAHLS